MIMVKCEQCGSQMKQSEIKLSHSQLDCLQSQLTQKNELIAKQQESIEFLLKSLDSQSQILKQLANGQPQQIQAYEYYTAFYDNFEFYNY